MTLETVLQLVRDQVISQALQPDGPDLNQTLIVSANFDDDLATKRVLEVKGRLVVEIVHVPSLEPGNDDLRSMLETLREVSSVPQPHQLVPSAQSLAEGDPQW